MGRLLNIVGYVTGLQGDGSDTQTDYVFRKRDYLHSRARVLADFGNALIEKKRWASAYPIDQCTVETVVETNLDNRPELRSLVERKEIGKERGEEFTFLIVEQQDLCRGFRRTIEEEHAFEDIMYPYLSVVFAAGFKHDLRLSPLEREKISDSARSVYLTGDKVLKKISEMMGGHSNTSMHCNVDDLVGLQSELLAHTSDANGMLTKFVELINRRQGR